MCRQYIDTWTLRHVEAWCQVLCRVALNPSIHCPDPLQTPTIGGATRRTSQCIRIAELRAFESAIPKKKKANKILEINSDTKRTAASSFYREPLVATAGTVGARFSAVFSAEGDSRIMSTFVSSGLEMGGLWSVLLPPVFPALFIRLLV